MCSIHQTRQHYVQIKKQPQYLTINNLTQQWCFTYLHKRSEAEEISADWVTVHSACHHQHPLPHQKQHLMPQPVTSVKRNGTVYSCLQFPFRLECTSHSFYCLRGT